MFVIFEIEIFQNKKYNCDGINLKKCELYIANELR